MTTIRNHSGYSLMPPAAALKGWCEGTSRTGKGAALPCTPADQGDGTPADQGDGTPADQGDGTPAGQGDGTPADQGGTPVDRAMASLLNSCSNS